MNFKITATLVGTVAVALALTVMLNYVKFERTYSKLVESRFAFVVQDLRTIIQTGLDLGLDLAAMSNVQTIIEREAGRDTQILSISVFDKHGALRFHYGELAGTAGAPPTLGSAAPPKTSHKAPADLGVSDVSVDLVNNFEQPVGKIVLRYDHSFYNRSLRHTLRVMCRTASAILIATSVVACVGVWLLLLGVNQSFARMRKALQHLLEQTGASGFQPDKGSELELSYVHAEEKSLEACKHLMAARKILSLEQQLGNGGQPEQRRSLPPLGDADMVPGAVGQVKG